MKPVNKISALGLTFAKEQDGLAFTNLHRKQIERLAFQYRRRTGKHRKTCLDDVCRALGFDDFMHYKMLWRNIPKPDERWRTKKYPGEGPRFYGKGPPADLESEK